jgi:hypothetical protein
MMSDKLTIYKISPFPSSSKRRIKVPLLKGGFRGIFERNTARKG